MWLFRILLALLQILLLVAVEVALRLGGYGYDPHFFKRIRIGGEEYFVQNEDFSLRFFPKEIVRNPGPVRFPIHKTPGTFRIFILGESAAMGDPSQSYAPYRYLEMLLREKYPDRKFEVINVAFTAINSHVLLPIARECAMHEGDLWIIYMGNNEMVGPFGAATVFGSQAASRLQVQLVTALQRLRTGQWLMELGRRFAGSGEKSAGWGGMGMFLRNQVAPDSPLKETVYRNFQKNLEDIVRVGINSGAEVLLNTVAVNLKDFPPLASLSESNLPTAERAKLDQLYADAMRAAAKREFAEAANLFAQAAQLNPKSAEMEFHWGESLLAQNNVVGAQEHFQLACDYDALPFRADSRINAAIRAEREKNANENLILFDAAAALAASGGAGLCGQETFFEHVHFDFDGRYRLGRAWAEQIAPLLPRNANAWLSEPACGHKLGLSEWNRAQVIHFMVERMQAPPLNSQTNNAARREALEARINQSRTQMNAEHAQQTRQVFQKLLEERPDDYFLHQNFAVFLEVSGDLARAAVEWLRFRDLLPQDSLGYYQAGRLLIAQQRYAEAEALLQTALSIRPSRAEAWIEIGNAQALQQKLPEALATYSAALKRDPQNAQTLLRRGRVLAKLGRRVEAIESYRASITLNPADWVAHHQLGLELVAAQQLEAAGTEFGEAARLSPDSVMARFDYGTWLLNQKHWDAAKHEFEAVLRLEPGNARAQQHVNWLQARKRQAP